MEVHNTFFTVLALGFPKMMSKRIPGLKKHPKVEQKSEVSKGAKCGKLNKR